MMIMFPLTFLSNAFVPADTLPDWLQTFVKHQPGLPRRLRRRATSPTTARSPPRSAGRCSAALVVVAIFAPLAVRSYKKHL